MTRLWHCPAELLRPGAAPCQDCGSDTHGPGGFSDRWPPSPGWGGRTARVRIGRASPDRDWRVHSSAAWLEVTAPCPPAALTCMCLCPQHSHRVDRATLLQCDLVSPNHIVAAASDEATLRGPCSCFKAPQAILVISTARLASSKPPRPRGTCVPLACSADLGGPVCPLWNPPAFSSM